MTNCTTYYTYCHHQSLEYTEARSWGLGLGDVATDPAGNSRDTNQYGRPLASSRLRERPFLEVNR
ncbi:MAG: hypothetical protein JSV68_01255 [Anaerolineaceae bacterium]|nr:MAG: hypothetical protein JSV68_01255 [Anaerolineaceae bacterium]